MRKWGKPIDMHENIRNLYIVCLVDEYWLVLDNCFETRVPGIQQILFWLRFVDCVENDRYSVVPPYCTECTKMHGKKYPIFWRGRWIPDGRILYMLFKTLVKRRFGWNLVTYKMAPYNSYDRERSMESVRKIILGPVTSCMTKINQLDKVPYDCFLWTKANVYGNYLRNLEALNVAIVEKLQPFYGR